MESPQVHAYREKIGGHQRWGWGKWAKRVKRDNLPVMK